MHLKRGELDSSHFRRCQGEANVESEGSPAQSEEGSRSSEGAAVTFIARYGDLLMLALGGCAGACWVALYFDYRLGRWNEINGRDRDWRPWGK
jgi:hypothetical protein